MAKKKQATPILELEKTLVVDDTTYNINAVHSDSSDSASEANHALEADHAINADEAEKAKKVNEKFTINKVGLINTTTVNYDGSVSQNIDIVPASGGKFSGNIAVRDLSNDELASNGELVLNYNSIVTKIVDKLINTSTMATWDNSSKKLIFVNSSAAVNGLCVVKGNNSELTTFSAENNKAKWLPDYLFICTDTGNIYCGTSTSTATVQLALKATQLVSSSSNESYFDFNDILNLTSLVNQQSQELSELNKTINDLDEAIETTAKNLASAESAARWASTIASTNNEQINWIKDGNITVGNAASANMATYAASAGNAESAGSATKATQDSDGKQINLNYFRSASNNTTVNTITISSNTPSGGSNGDIWIKY